MSYGVPELFADRIQSIEIIGPVIRLALTAGPDRVPLEQREIVGYILLPLERVPGILRFLAGWYSSNHVMDDAAIIEQMLQALH